jgi:VWFA-related protein
VGGLRPEDFQLLDNKKPRPITRFSVEEGAAAAPNPQVAHIPEKPATDAQPAERSVAYLFDDINLAKGDLVRVQSAAEHQMSLLPSNVQAAIFTTSGQDALEFTADRTKLRETLLNIKPRKGVNGEGNGCPDIDTYMADLIWNKQDEDALGAAMEETLTCAFADNPKAFAAAESMTRATAHQQFVAGEADSLRILLALQAALRKLAAAQGQRTLVLISPGFFAVGREQEFARLIDGALHSDIVISALDARGLYNIDSTSSRSRAGTEYRREAASVNAELLTTLADSTGGTFFHNNNDFNAGLARVAQTPEYSYVLGFSPADQELDGRFHALNVTISNKDEKLALQARKGYYATPRPAK